jgi:hypothetical protein
MREAAAAWVVRHESWVVYLLGAGAFGAIPLSLGYLGLSWDALNHHIYLGWVAERPRFDRDYVAAGYQAYQFPYLYWPFYKLAMMGLSGATAGLVLALLHSLAIPPTWLMARSMITGGDIFAVGMRALAVALAFISGAILSLFDSTSNDLLASIPLLWAYALALRPLGAGESQAWHGAVASGALAGAAVACKLSNGYLVLALPLLWLCAPGPVLSRLGRCLLACTAVWVAFALCYGYWGWQLWKHFGNPIYPFSDPSFDGLRALTGWLP